MSDSVTLDLRRFGDVVSYVVDGASATVRGQHLLGSRYELTLKLVELRPDYHTYWLKDSRQGIQLLFVVVFLVVFCVTIGWAALFPDFAKQHGGWLAGALAVCLVALLGSAFARRVEVAVFAYKSGVEAFRVPAWGCAPESRRSFLEALKSRIPHEGNEAK
jgi:hypothetical protein